MTDKPWLLDLFCGAGGATRGYQRAGFRVAGIDIVSQPHYIGDTFLREDAVDTLRSLVAMLAGGLGTKFVAIHASPPCQAYTKSNRVRPENIAKHPDLVSVTRDFLTQTGLPFVIENVPGAPLVEPVTLCGAMFDLRVYRHRLFEVHGFDYTPPPHPTHVAPQVKMGRKPKPGEFHQPVGHFSDVAGARAAMDIDWMVRNELSESIPPAYTEHVGQQLLQQLG